MASITFYEVFQKSIQNSKFQELQNWCNNIIVKHPEKIFESKDFTSIKENSLISLIKRDDLQMDEIKIWNHVIEWGIAQNSEMPSDPKNWSNENFLTLKTTLQNCLPYIRYFQIPGVLSIILPPRVILKHTLPPRTTDPFSTIINEVHAAEITSWIDKKAEPYSAVNNPYVFKLLLRGTRDGFTPAPFWNLCDRQRNIVVIAKIKDTDEILGGYNPIGWDKSINCGHMDCDESFIFSLKNGTIQNSILSRVKNSKYAIYCKSNCGPAFGGGGGGCDLVFFNPDQCRNRQFSYEKRIRNVTYDDYGHSYFSVDEYEIFQLVNSHKY
ncbi:hypothetical protein C2G38_2032280 [Gigaspora rosea]|uniref:TLDc domain-containing protein n=1 Tax=Gigaspora rosea TaxID=44941 RepID=A0A397VSG0_9GLOM|nr:hypothetical protein C2G38_2032280 [Gigaspora rosea]